MLVKDNLSPKHTRGIRDFETGYGMVIVQFRSFPLAYVENGRDQSRGPFMMIPARAEARTKLAEGKASENGHWGRGE
jgi:hypothetical protein